MDFDHDKISPMMTPWCRSAFSSLQVMTFWSPSSHRCNYCKPLQRIGNNGDVYRKLDRPTELSTGGAVITTDSLVYGCRCPLQLLVALQQRLQVGGSRLELLFS